ncbi:MAG: acyltransferase [Pedobacter sp.]|nr:MAG: acyltransferase [Pedobacter sp.]
MTKKNQNLEVVRGLAAFQVLLCHFFGKIPYFSKFKGPLLGLISNWGTEAVIVFFVLSGIVIHSSFEKTPKKPLYFLKDRLIRIHPILIITVILSLFCEQYVFGKLPANTTIIGNLIPVSTLQGALTPVLWNSNPVIWSLSFELFFYFIFAFFIIPFKSTEKGVKIWLSLGIIGLILTIFGINPTNQLCRYALLMFSYSPIWLIGYFIWGQKDNIYISFQLSIFSLLLLPLISRLHILNDYYDPVRYTVFALTLIPIFILLLKPIRLTSIPEKKSYKIFSAYLMLYILASILIIFDDSYPVLSKILYIALPLCAMLTFFKSIEVFIFSIYHISIKPVFSYIGSISYGLYLIHYPLIVIIFSPLINIPIIYKIPLFLILVFFVAVILEKFIQKKINILLK